MENTMSISEFKATCLKVISSVKETGIPLVITKRGVPCALISPPPLPKKEESWIGKFSDDFTITGDIIEPACPATDWEVLK